jgi:molecular chaperone GrpE
MHDHKDNLEQTENQEELPNESLEDSNPEINEQETSSSGELALQEMQDKFLRLMAEFENYKRRISKERMELISTAGKETIVACLPVLDDMDRAIGTVEDEGIKLIFAKLHSTLKAKGLKGMESTGELFDAELHEAITEIPAGEEFIGKVVDTVEKGYFLNDKLIRHAKVVVGK